METKKPTPLYSIYGYKDSKDGKRINITLITGEAPNKEYATISIKKENVDIKEDVAYIKVKKLKPIENNESINKDKIKDDDIPF